MAPAPETARTRAAGAIAALEVRLHPTVREVPESEWDALVGPDDLLASHRFVRACEDARVEEAVYRHVTVRQGGRLVAIASLALVQVRLELLSGTALRGVVSAVRRTFPGFLRLPTLLGGLPVSFGTSLLRVAPDADRGDAVAAIARAADEAAAELGAGLVVFKEFGPHDRAPAEALLDHGYFEAASLPACALQVRWRSFEAYAAAMRSGYRRQLLTDLLQRDREGLLVRTVEGLGGRDEEVFALYEQVMDRVPFQLERLPAGFFRALATAFGARHRTVLLEAEGRLVAAAVLLRAPRTLWFLLVGLDYARMRHGHVYQNLVAAVVAEGIRCGAERVELGQTSYELKGRLGGRTSERILFLRHRRPGVHRALRAAAPLLFPDRAPGARRPFRST
jgi:predicted N-acyltransferase